MDENFFSLLRAAAEDGVSSDDLGMDISRAEDYSMGEISFTASVESPELDVLRVEEGAGDLTLGFEDGVEADDDLVAIWNEKPEGKTSSVLSYSYDREAIAYERESEKRADQQKKIFRQSVDSAIIEARKSIVKGIRGASLVEHLKASFSRPVLKVAFDVLSSRAIDQFLLGNVIVEPEMYASCDELSLVLSHGYARSSKFAKAIEDCKTCPKRTSSTCNLFGKTLVDEVPNDRKVFAFYRKKLADLGLIDEEIARIASSTPDYRLALATLFLEADKGAKRSQIERREYSTDKTYSPYAAPERRVAKTPRQAVLNKMESMVESGETVATIRSASSLLGKSAFSDAFITVANRFEAIPWETFGSCDHPLLMDKRGSFELERGPKCSGCVYDGTTACSLNKKSFVDVTPEVRGTSLDTMEGYQEHFAMFDVDPDLEVTASEDGVEGIDATQISGLGSFEV